MVERAKMCESENKQDACSRREEGGAVSNSVEVEISKEKKS